MNLLTSSSAPKPSKAAKQAAEASLQIRLDGMPYKIKLGEHQSRERFLKLASHINQQITTARKAMPLLSRERLFMFMLLNVADSQLEGTTSLASMPSAENASSPENHEAVHTDPMRMRLLSLKKQLMLALEE